MLNLDQKVKNDEAARALGFTWRRWLVLALLLAITTINFVDRQTLSVLAPVLRAAFHLSNEQYGRIVAALQFGMMSGEFPMGALMDRWGARLGLCFAVLWWSAATGTQVVTNSGVKFGVVRYWMGTGECGNYSGGMKTVMQVFPEQERTLAIGIFNSGSMIGATIAPPIIVFLLQRYGFHAAFLVPAIAGLIWVPMWWFGRGKERFSPSARANIFSSDSVKTLLSERRTWAVMLCRFFIGPVIQFYWYWIPNYLFSVRHMSMVRIGLVAWLPFLLGTVGGVAGGFAANLLQRRGVSTLNVRRITMYGSSIACLTSLLVPEMKGIASALAMIGAAILADNFLSANMYGAITDLFPDRRVGRVTGLTGVAGGFSGLLFPLLTGFLVDRLSYKPVFLLIGVMPLLGTLALFLLANNYNREAPASIPNFAPEHGEF